MTDIDSYMISLRTAAMRGDPEAFDKIIAKRQENIDKRLLEVIGEDDESNGGTQEETPGHVPSGTDGPTAG